MKRLRGLLGTKDSTHCGDGLHLTNCSGVHTWFMRYPLDIAFLNTEDHVVGVFRLVKPYRAIRGGRRAHSVIERKASAAPWPSIGQRVEFNECPNISNGGEYENVSNMWFTSNR